MLLKLWFAIIQVSCIFWSSNSDQEKVIPCRVSSIKKKKKSVKFVWKRICTPLLKMLSNKFSDSDLFSVVNDERIVNGNAKKTRIFYIFMRLSIKVWAFFKWNGISHSFEEYYRKRGTTRKRKLRVLMNETNWAVSYSNECVQIVVNHALPFI